MILLKRLFPLLKRSLVSDFLPKKTSQNPQNLAFYFAFSNAKQLAHPER